MPDTVPGDTTSTALAPLGKSIYGTIDTAGDHDWYRVDLVAGQTYEFRLHGMGRGQLVDPQLFLRDAAGTLITSNDDAGATQWDGANATDSFLQFTAAASGTYLLDVGEFGDNATGDFLLTAVVDTPSGMIFTPDEIAWQLVDNGWGFFGRGPAAFNVGGDGALTVNITGLTLQGQFLARNALQAWTDVTGIQFVETGGSAELTFDDNASGVQAYANSTVSGTTITSSTVQVTTGWLTQFGTGLNSYSFETYIHEIGHALGLAHGGNYNGSAIYGTDNYYLNDSLAYSIMSYMQANGDEFSGSIVNTFVNADFRYMLTPAMADIIAIQNLYGDNSAARTGNTTYGYNSNTGNAALDAAVGIGADMFMTVHDDGGVDTLDFSGTGASQTISLYEETFSNVLGGRMNLSIARGTLIENARGGGGADTLTGNALANVLEGGAGTDTLLAGAGNDTVLGGAGYDSLYGEVGDDYMYGGGDADLFYGGDGNDSLNGGVGLDAMYGGAGNDNLFGGDGNDTLSGGEGDDYLVGGAGNNSFYGDAGNDSLNDGPGGGYLSGGAGNDNLFGGDGDDAMLGGDDTDYLVGGTGNNSLFGDAGNDSLNDGDGQGYLSGGAGDDGLFGGGGADRFASGSGTDFMVGGAGGDTYIISTGDGADTIADLNVLEDRVNLTALAGLDTFADVQARLSFNGLNTLLDLGGGDVVTFMNIRPETLTSAMFDV